MMRWRRTIFFAGLISICFGSFASNYHMKTVQRTGKLYQAFHSLGNVIEDAILLNVKLFTIDSAKIITGFLPFFLSARMFDESVQSHFYDRSCHKNIRQMHNSCHQIAQKGVGVPMVLLSSLALWAPNERLRQTARMFAIGLPFVHWGKNIIKTLDTNICLRPWNEHFNRRKRSTGGFPSGHMANVTYMTALFGMRHGWKWGVPLGLFSSFVFADFLNCNRHYLSQLIAGVGFGLLYAFAADKVIHWRAAQNLKFDLRCEQDGKLIASMSCRF
ncbi:hypothetical protein HYX58_01840 [Candidatus Dependentiae bacterium]|nr:hypothetical protein [Candidatus Dependentiae bacterium]